MKIKGEYQIRIPVNTMFIHEEIVIRGENLITLLGESFFMNRWVNDELPPIQYIVLGTGTKRPTKNDLQLAHETARKLTTNKVNIMSKRLELYANFLAEEIINTTEIGAHNGEILISHDLFKAIQPDMVLGDATSTVNLTYMFTLVSGSFRSGWEKSVEEHNIYYLHEAVPVVGVNEANTGSGYVKKSSVEELKTVLGAYYYNHRNKTLYIRTSKDSDPNKEEIIVEN